MKKLLLLLCTFLCSVVMWADNIASGTFDGKAGTYTTGWSTTGTGKQRNDCIVIAGSENITSPAIDFSLYSDIKISIKARRYGTVPKISGTSTAVLTVKANNVTIGTANATSTTATTALSDINFTITASALASYNGPIVVTCSNVSGNGSSGNGAGVNSITITGTLAGGSNVSAAKTLQVPYEETSETFDVTWTNMESKDVYLYDDAECNTTFSGDWFTAAMASNGEDVDYMAAENTTGADRVVYMQLYGLDSEANEYTHIVAVTQKHFIADYATLPMSVENGTTSAALKGMDGVTGLFDGSDYNNNTHKVKFGKNTHYMQIKTNAQIGSCTFSFKGAGGAGSSTFDVLSSSDGTEWTTVETFTVTFAAQNDVVEHITTVAFAATDRYIKLAFKKNTGEVNVGLGKFTINAYEAPENVTISAAGYATYSSNKAKYVVAPAKAYTFTTELKEIEDGIIPANTGVVIEGTTSASLLTVTTDATIAENNLKAVASNMTAAEMTTTNPGSNYFYALSLNSAGEANSVGFYWRNNGGAAFDITAGKAYLVLPQSSAPVRGFAFNGGEATAIKTVNTTANNTVRYNLAGQRVNANAKGIVIVNGKKIIK